LGNHLGLPFGLCPQGHEDLVDFFHTSLSLVNLICGILFVHSGVVFLDGISLVCHVIQFNEKSIKFGLLGVSICALWHGVDLIRHLLFSDFTISKLVVQSLGLLLGFTESKLSFSGFLGKIFLVEVVEESGGMW
jgi:hypothetical protein